MEKAISYLFPPASPFICFVGSLIESSCPGELKGWILILEGFYIFTGLLRKNYGWGYTGLLFTDLEEKKKQYLGFKHGGKSLAIVGTQGQNQKQSKVLYSI